MKFSDVAKALGIESYPSALDRICEDPNLPKADICNEKLIQQLQKDYNTFGDYCQDVLEAVRTISNDPIRFAWAQTVATYDLTAELSEARTILCPQTDGTLLGNMLPMLAMIPMIPLAIAEYRKRGFSEDVIANSASAYGRCMGAVARLTGKPGLNQLYFTWLCIFAKARIFHLADYNFEVKKCPEWVYVLRNKESGNVELVSAKRKIHNSGLFLGSAGCEDEEGSFDADFQETDTCYTGHPIRDHVVANEKITYLKSLWECTLRPDDYVLNLHIPSGVDLTPERIRASMQTGMQAAKEFYPDIPIRLLVCSSWLLNPILEDFLGSDSKIAGFGRMFQRFPVGGGGRSGFNFIFPGKTVALHELPENTRLQRAVKNHVLNGGQLQSFGGIYNAY